MSISAVFIRRPVMTTLAMAGFLLAGAFGYTTLSVSELPSIDYPTINVRANLPGASAETMARAVATPLEKQFSTIPGIDSMNSQSQQGSTNITITFRLDRNIDAAAQDVQAAISATPRLPRDMPSPPSMRKQNPADQPILTMKLSSPTLPISEVNAYAEDLILPKIATIDGVAAVDIQGQARRAIRIQVDPDALATRGIGIDQVQAAIRAVSVNQATGQLDGLTRSPIIEAQGQLLSAPEFERQIVAYRDGGPVRLGDVANVIESIENNRNYSTYNGQPNIGLNIRRQPGANTVAVVDAVRAEIASIQTQLPPSITLDVTFDRSLSIRDAINDVQWTLIGSALLVVGVIFVFLRSLTATLIPAVAMPIAIIGAFAGMAFMGFSLDNLSLMALTLSVIFIVDDAIVMLENIMRHVEAGEKPYDAALIGSREVGSTILTMTVSLAAVFIPVLFMGGILGRLLHEFAVTIVIAIVISGIVSVTLTPMLCSLVVKPMPAGGHAQHGRVYEITEAGFTWLLTRYENSLRWAMGHKRFILGCFFASLLATGMLFRIMPQDFLPSDDANQINGGVQLANGTSFLDTVAHQKRVEDVIRQDPNVVGVSSAIYGGRNGNIQILIKPRDERPNQMNIDEVMNGLRRKLSVIPGVNVFLQNPPAFRIGGISSRSQYQYTLQGADRDELYAVSQKLVTALKREPGFVGVDTDLDLSTPSIEVSIDRDAAASLGVTAQQIETALGAGFSGGQVSTIYTSVDQYQVIMEMLPKYQRDMSALQRLYLTGPNATLIPLSAVTKIAAGSSQLSENHLGQLPAVTISFGLEPGIPLSDGVTLLEKVKDDIGFPASVSGSFQGTAQAFQQSMQGMGFLLLGGVLVVYIVLGILYESFIHPLTILSGLPAAAAGALATLLLFHYAYQAKLLEFDTTLTLYAYVGMIMLIGIVKKNAIMMIDFALSRQRSDDLNPELAIVEAATVRFRPIMMTTMAALVGAVPIALGIGSGGEGRRPLGIAVVGGLIVSQLLTLYITPVIYVYLDRLGSRLSLRRRNVAVLPAE